MANEKVTIDLEDFLRYQKLDTKWEETKNKLEEKLKSNIHFTDVYTYFIGEHPLSSPFYTYRGRDLVIQELVQKLNTANGQIKSLNESFESRVKNASLWQRITRRF